MTHFAGFQSAYGHKIVIFQSIFEIFVPKCICWIWKCWIMYFLQSIGTKNPQWAFYCKKILFLLNHSSNLLSENMTPVETNNYDHFHNFPVKMIHFLQLLADVEDVQKDIGFFATRTLLHLSSRVDVVDRQTDSSY